jgi:glycosyltransferase involved in cell wall biosynthesis
LKIVRVITRLNIGGPSKQVFFLNAELPKKTYNQIVVFGTVEKTEIEIDLRSFKNIIKIESLSRSISIIQDVRSIIKLSKIFRKYKPDIIHTHLSKAWAIAIIAKSLSHSNASVVHTFHGHILFSYFSGMKNVISISIQKYLAQRSDKLIAVGEQIKHDLLNYEIGTESKFCVIQPGFPVPKNIKGAEVMKRPDTPIRLLFVGRLEAVKQPLILIDVCKILSKRKISYQLDVVGSGTLKAQMQARAEFEKLDIYFHGWQRNPNKFFIKSDVMVICSANEGTPISILEAASYQVPTVAFRVGSIPDLIQNNSNGYLVNTNAASLAEKIIYLSKNRKKLEALGIKAKETFIRNNSLERFIEEHENVYQNLMR